MLFGRPHPMLRNRSSISAMCVSTTTIRQAEPNSWRNRHTVLFFAKQTTEPKKKAPANGPITAKVAFTLRSLLDPHPDRADIFGRTVTFPTLESKSEKFKLRHYRLAGILGLRRAVPIDHLMRDPGALCEKPADDCLRVWGAQTVSSLVIVKAPVIAASEPLLPRCGLGLGFQN